MPLRLQNHRADHLFIRREGELWCAYFSLFKTLDHALFLGSIAIAAVERSPERERAFMDLMKDAVAEALEGHGTVGRTDERPAPEHERAGLA